MGIILRWKNSIVCFKLSFLEVVVQQPLFSLLLLSYIPGEGPGSWLLIFPMLSYMAFLENSRRMIWRVGCGGVVLFNVSVRVGCVVYRVCFCGLPSFFLVDFYVFYLYVFFSSKRFCSASRLVGRPFGCACVVDAHAWVFCIFNAIG